MQKNEFRTIKKLRTNSVSKEPLLTETTSKNLKNSILALLLAIVHEMDY